MYLPSVFVIVLIKIMSSHFGQTNKYVISYRFVLEASIACKRVWVCIWPVLSAATTLSCLLQLQRSLFVFNRYSYIKTARVTVFFYIFQGFHLDQQTWKQWQNLGTQLFQVILRMAWPIKKKILKISCLYIEKKK